MDFLALQKVTELTNDEISDPIEIGLVVSDKLLTKTAIGLMQTIFLKCDL